MSFPRRLFVGSLLAGILGLQAYFAAPPNNGGWYWPFLDYPMYATARYVGDEIAFRRLEGVACQGGGTTDVDHEDLGVAFYLLDHLSNAIIEGGPGAVRARASLRAMIREKQTGDLCAVRVLLRSVRLGEGAGRAARDAPWVAVDEVRLR